jgi:hypothetical protein
VDVMEGDARVVGVEPVIVAVVMEGLVELEHPPQQLCFLLAEVDFANLQMTNSRVASPCFSFLFFSFLSFSFFFSVET